MRQDLPVLLLLALLTPWGFACADEAAKEAEQIEAVKQAEDDPWLDAIEDEEPTPGDPAAVAAADPNAVVPATPSDPAAAAAPGTEAAPLAADAPAAAASDDAPAVDAPKPTSAGANNPAKPAAAQPVAPDAPPAPVAAADTPADAPPPDAEAAPAPAPEAQPAPPPEPAEPPPITLADFNGSYRFVGGSAQRQALSDAIDDAAMGLPGIIRGIGRKRLTKTNPIDDHLSLQVTGDQVTTTFASGFNPTATLGGGQVTWTSKKSGDKYRVRIKQKGNKLIQVIAGDDGLKTTVFVLSADRSRLTVHHKITADRLPEPMTYKLTYARK